MVEFDGMHRPRITLLMFERLNHYKADALRPFLTKKGNWYQFYVKKDTKGHFEVLSVHIPNRKHAKKWFKQYCEER